LKLCISAAIRNYGQKSESLQATIIKLQQQLTDQTEKHQTHLAQARQLQEQSEDRWLKLIDQTRIEWKEAQKNYENRQSKQAKQIETLQKQQESFKNKIIEQQSALNHAQTTIVDLKQQTHKLQSEYNEAVAQVAVLKAKLEHTAKEKAAKKQAKSKVVK